MHKIIFIKEKTYFGIIGIIFLIIAILHLLRIIFNWDAQISAFNVPMWLSWIALVIAGYLSFEAYRLMK